MGKYKTIRNTFVIFLVSGFWHGASWNFIVWGVLHALGFLILLLFNKNRIHVNNIVAQNKIFPTLKEFFQMAATFIFVSFAWIFFRLSDINDALKFVFKIFIDFWDNPKSVFFKPFGWSILLYIFPLIVIDWYLRNDDKHLKVPENKFFRYSVYFIFSFFVLYFMGSNTSSFIYFQF